MEFSRILSFTGPVVKRSDLHYFAGKTLGIDSESFIKAIFNSLPSKLLNNENLFSALSENLDLLISLNIKPFFVFNGVSMVIKSKKREIENENHKKNVSEFEQAIAEGKENRAAGLRRNCFRIDSEIVNTFREIIQSKGVESIFAPFEASAELTYLNSIDFIDAIYTEDAQVLIFNPKLVLFQFSFVRHPHNTSILTVTSDDVLSFYDMSKDRFAQMCALAGELYSPAEITWNFSQLQQMYKSKESFHDIVNNMREANPCIANDYQAHIIKEVKNAFHQIVYDPNSDSLTTLNPCQEPLPSNYRKEDLLKVVKGNMKPESVQQTCALHWNSSAETSPKRKPRRKSSTQSPVKMNSILSFFPLKKNSE